MQACMWLSDDFMVELSIDVFQDAKVMSEHKVDIEVSTIIGLGQNTEAKFVKQVRLGDQLVSRGRDWSSREQQR